MNQEEPVQAVGWDGLTVGERLRRLRKEKNLSQRSLAEKGVSYAYISRVEAGTRDPSVKAIRMLADKLDVDPHWLESGDGMTGLQIADRDVKALIEDLENANLSPAGRRLLRALRQRR